MQHRGDNRSIPAQQRITAHEFATQNSTSHHFLGAAQRPWRTGAIPIPPSGPCPVKKARRGTGSNREDSRVELEGQDSVNGTSADSEAVCESLQRSEEQQHLPNQTLPTRGSSVSAHNDNAFITLQTSEYDVIVVQPSTSHSTGPVPSTSELFETLPTHGSRAAPVPADLQQVISPSLPTSLTPANTPLVLPGQWQSFSMSEPLRFSAAPVPPNVMAPSEQALSSPATSLVASLAIYNPTSTGPPFNFVTRSQSPPLVSPVLSPEAVETRKRSALIEADLPNKKARQANFPTQQVPTPSSTPVLAHQHPYLKHLQMLVERVRQQSQMNGIEEQRIALLAQACLKEDMFFMVLHQVYSLASLQQRSVTRLGFGAAEKAGLTAVEPILVPNKHLSQLLLEAFANFPRQSQALHEPAMSRTVEQVKDFFVVLGMRWEAFKQNCLARAFPPCCEETVHYFSLSSSLMQKTLFNSLERQISGIKNQAWQTEAIRLFERSQNQYKHQHAQPGYSLDHILFATVQAFGHEYQNLLATRDRIQPALLSASSTPTHVVTQLPLQSPQGNPHVTFPIVATSGSQAQYMNPYYANVPPSNGHPHPGVRSNTAYGMSPYARPPTLTNTATGRQSRHLSPGHFVMHSQEASPAVASPGPGQRIPVQSAAEWRRPSIAKHQSYSVAPNPHLQEPALARRHGRPHRGSGVRNTQTTLPLQQANLMPIALNSNPTAHVQSGAQHSVAASAHPCVGPIQEQYLKNFQGFNSALSNQLLPPPGYIMPQTIQPNADRIALHQVHVRSPPFVKLDTDNRPTEGRLYAYQESFVLLPQKFDHRDKLVVWHFDVAETTFATKARCAAPPMGVDVSGARVYKSGCTLFRLKCIKQLGSLDPPSTAEYSEMALSWPMCAFVSLNETQDVEMRRKAHWGRDLAADLTNLIQLGNNTITLSYHSVPSEEKEAFYVAVEVVRVSDHTSTRALAQSIDKADALSAIIGPLNTEQDDEISFTDPSISIDLMDPFMAKIWETPARGNRCKHRECFDLESFLLSRTTRQKNGPTDPDRWNCPICNKDARPQNLVIDQFLVDLRTQLELNGKLEARAIMVKQDGTWEAKMEPEEERGVKTGTTSGMKSKSTSAQPEVGGVGLNADTALADAAATTTLMPGAIIEIEDDD